MLKDYNEYRYLYPPRPESAIAPSSLGFYETRGWVAQFKKNGTGSVVFISPEKQITIMTRHATPHKQWQMTDHIREELKRLFPEKFWVVLIAELMHSKTKAIKNTLYIHDLIVWDNRFLLGSTFLSRQSILNEHLITNVETPTHYICDTENKIWYAKRFSLGFKDLFFGIEDPAIDEGLVLKNPEGKLKDCDTPDRNASWQIKARHTTKNYQF